MNTNRAWIYILHCNDGSLYVGLTQRSVEARVSEHNAGEIPGYAANRRPVELLYSEAYPRLDEAIVAERRIKGWSRAKKIAYIRGDFPSLQTISKSRKHPRAM